MSLKVSSRDLLRAATPLAFAAAAMLGTASCSKKGGKNDTNGTTTESNSGDQEVMPVTVLIQPTMFGLTDAPKTVSIQYFQKTDTDLLLTKEETREVPADGRLKLDLADLETVTIADKDAKMTLPTMDIQSVKDGRAATNLALDPFFVMDGVTVLMQKMREQAASDRLKQQELSYAMLTETAKAMTDAANLALAAGIASSVTQIAAGSIAQAAIFGPAVAKADAATKASLASSTDAAKLLKAYNDAALTQSIQLAGKATDQAAPSAQDMEQTMRDMMANIRASIEALQASAINSAATRALTDTNDLVLPDLAHVLAQIPEDDLEAIKSVVATYAAQDAITHMLSDGRTYTDKERLELEAALFVVANDAKAKDLVKGADTAFATFVSTVTDSTKDPTAREAALGDVVADLLTTHKETFGSLVKNIGADAHIDLSDAVKKACEGHGGTYAEGACSMHAAEEAPFALKPCKDVAQMSDADRHTYMKAVYDNDFGQTVCTKLASESCDSGTVIGWNGGPAATQFGSIRTGSDPLHCAALQPLSGIFD